MRHFLSPLPARSWGRLFRFVKIALFCCWSHECISLVLCIWLYNVNWMGNPVECAHQRKLWTIPKCRCAFNLATNVHFVVHKTFSWEIEKSIRGWENCDPKDPLKGHKYDFVNANRISSLSLGCSKASIILPCFNYALHTVKSGWWIVRLNILSWNYTKILKTNFKIEIEVL